MQQRVIDWTRSSQLALLWSVILPERKVGRDTVSGPLQLAVLRCIDNHAGASGEAWMGYDRLSAETGYSVRSVKRAISALEEASLIICETRRSSYGVVCNHYRVVWSELDLLPRVTSSRTVPDRSARPVPDRREAAERSAMVSERSAMVSERSAMVSLPECHGVTQTAKELSPNRPEPPRPAAREPAGGGGEVVSWEGIVTEWRSRIGQIATLAEQARAAGETPGDFLDRLRAGWEVVTHPANRKTLTKPAGAMVHWLRAGTWPVDGLVDPADQQATAARTAIVERRAAESAWSQTQAMLTQLVKRGRQAGATDEQIRAAMLDRVSPADVARFGW